MSSELTRAISSPLPPKLKIDKLREILQDAISRQDVQFLRTFVPQVFADDTLALAQTRPFLNEFARLISTLPDDIHKSLAEYTLDQLQARAQSYELGFSTLRFALARILEKEERFGEAADHLARIRWDGPAVDLDLKADILVKVARFYLLDNRPDKAELFLNNARMLVNRNQGTKNTAIHFQACFAQVLDAKQKFEDAAIKYYYLSQMVTGQSQPELLQWLMHAVRSTILAKAGPRRSQLLGKLYSDERTRNLKVFPLLDAFYMERLVNSEQISEFAAMLQSKPYAAKTSDGSTVLEKAVLMHNLMAASKLYSSIRFEDLGLLLGVSKDTAEKTAARMIEEERIAGVVDQIEGVIIFEQDTSTTAGIQKWNEQVEQVCLAVDECATAILRAYPQLIE